MLPTLDEVKTHLDIPIADLDHDDELQDFLDTAVELVAHEIGEDPADVDITGRPALKTAIVEVVRDMWTSTQTGGATVGGGLEDDALDGGSFGLGRPALPPYVMSLLTPYRTVVGPSYSFPDPVISTWPEW